MPETLAAAAPRAAPPPFPVRAREAPGVSTARFLALVALQVAVALLMRDSELISTAHALLTLAVGLFWAVSKRFERVAYAAAYITGAEVLWRMTETRIFWEFGKYAVSAVLLAAIIRGRKRHGSALLLVYFALLLPSALLTLNALPISRARQELSFNLAGPLSLAVCAWFFSGARISRAGWVRLSLSLLLPISGVSTLVLTGILERPFRVFGRGISNPWTSGGFAPNQVSAVLGLGALVCFFLVREPGVRKGLRLLLFVAMVGLATQSALTYSRGGLYMAAGSAVVASLFLMRDARSRLTTVLVLGLCFVIGRYLIVPQLDALTGGTLMERFQDTGMTGREEIMRTDLELWGENPVLGVGPGMSKILRQDILGGEWLLHSHTEFTRLLSEHGALGALALLLLLFGAAGAIRRARGRRGRAYSAALIVWSLLFMVINAMRLVTPSFLFGLAFANLDGEEASPGRSRLPGPARRHADVLPGGVARA